MRDGVTLPCRAQGMFPLVCACLWLFLASASAQSNLVSLISQPGDYIGQGNTYYTTNAADFTLTGTLGTITVSAFGYTIQFDGPGSANLAAGNYPGATRYPFNGSNPGLSIYGNGRGCNTLCGSFQILAVSTNALGQVDRFHVTFTQQCECSTTQLTGEIRYVRPLSSDASLTGLETQVGALEPLFNSSTLAYTLRLASNANFSVFKPTKSDYFATIKVDGQPVASGSTSGVVNLSASSNLVNVLVTAQDGSTRNYTVAAIRTPPPPTNSVSLISQTGDYIGQGQTYYSTNLADFGVTGNVNWVTATAFGYDMVFVAPGSAPLGIGLYTNVVRWPFNGSAAGLKVSGNGRGPNTLTGSYSIMEIRTNSLGQVDRLWVSFVQHCDGLVPAMLGEIRYAAPPGTNASLTSLVVAAGAITPVFAQTTLSYQLTVAAGVNSTTLTPTAADIAASITVNGTSVATGTPSPPINLNYGLNFVSIVVTADDGVTKISYTLVINRLGSPPAITTQPTNQTVTAGANVTFSVGVTGTAPLFYQWRLAGTNLPGATNATLALANVQTNQAGNYSVVITNTAGSTTSGNAILTVNPPPVAPSITTHPVDQTAIVGSDAAFAVSATGTAPLFYQWQLGGTNLSGATNATLTLLNVQTNQAGNYSAVVTNMAGNATSSNAVLTVNAPPIITTQPISQGVTAGTGVAFSVAVAGTAPLSYQWLFNGGELTGLTNATLTLNPVTTNSTGPYQVVITNVAGSVTSSVAALTVNRRVPVLTWNTLAAITYGTALGAGQLNASTGVPGSLVYNPIADTLLGAGPQVLKVVFTPSDGSVFATNSAAVNLVVNPAALTATAVSQTRLAGQTNQPLVITYSGFVNGETVTNLTTLAIASTTADTNSPPGIYPINLSGASAANYNVSYVSGTITVVTNLPPSVTFATNTIVVLEDCGAQTFNNFASILPGTASNIVSVTVSNDQPALFAVAPTLNGSTLTFTPATNVNGIATVTVIAQSDGNGVNLATNTFTITVTPVNDAPGFKLLNTTALLTWGYNSSAQLGDGTGVDKSSPVPIGNATNWVMITAGDNHTMALRRDGTLWGWGYNFFGELGDGTGASQSTPVQISNETNWQTVVAGNDYTMALKRDGTLWGWGANINYQLGLGYNLFARSPVQVGTATDWKMVAPGETHTLALKRDGSLWAWGDNTHGSLGDGTAISRPTPVQIGTATNWQSVTAGAGHSVAVKRDGTLWAWGYNYFGQLGDGTTVDQTSPVQIGTATNWQLVAAGNYSTLAVKRDGTLWSFDTGGPEQFGTDSDWQTVTAGNSHGLGLKRNGTLWGWGYNNFGQVGDGTTVTRMKPVPVGAATNWLMVAGGGAHTVALALAGGASPALAVPENSGDFTNEDFALNIFAEPAGGSTQVVTFLTTNDNPALFSFQPAIDSGGTLTFTPATNAYGTTTVTVIAQDDGGTDYGGTNVSAPQTLTITVTAVNQAPILTFATNTVAVFANSGPALRSGFANLSPGPANESAQTIQNLALANDHPVLFSVQPAIDAGGNLTFTPANNTAGSATVTVVVQDNGGTANGGVDSATNRFTIRVNQLVPSLTWTAPPAVTYGTPLGAAQLNATPSVSGLLTYAPPAGTVLPVGTNVLGVTLAPTDSTTYLGATATVNWVVNRAALTATAVSQTRAYGMLNSPLTVNYSGFVNGETVADLTSPAVANTTADINSLPGTYPIVASGATAANYNITHIAGLLTVTAIPPVLVAGPTNQTVLAGTDVSFVASATGAPAPLYQWYYNATNALPGATNEMLMVPNAQPADEGSYTVVAANAGGSVTSAVATLTVYVLPAITTQPASQSVIQGGTVTFSVTATGTAPLSYQWQSNGVDVVGATSTTLTLLNAQAGQAGIYSVVVTNVAGRTTSSNAMLTVIAPPTVLMSRQDVTVPVGTNVTFDVTVGGTPPFAFQWLKNGTNLPAATNATLALLNVQAADQGSYKVTVGNPAGFDSSSAAMITVLDPPMIFAQPQSAQALLGSNVTLSVGATGSAPLSYRWFKGAIAIPGETNPTLVFTNLSVTNSGSYFVLVTNAVGSVLSDPALLNVHVPPFISVQPQSYTLAVGSGLNLRVTAGGDGPLAYQWRKNGTDLPGATANPFTVNNLTTNDAGSYSVVITNAYGALTSAPALIAVGVPMAPVILRAPANPRGGRGLRGVGGRP
ncbi:MAG: hypothetical protein EBS05_22250 [Proteobacteria bacterium]|nr:hypothetical protein [Pseudomonadota bacterium]